MKNIEKLEITVSDNFLLQNGTIPDGVGASYSKYTLNNGNVAFNSPTLIQTFYPLIPFTVLNPNFEIVMDDNWKKFIDSGDPIQLRRGNIVSEYSVQYAKYDIEDNTTTVKLSNFREYVNLLDPFISLSGYPNPSADSYVSLERRRETSNTIVSGINTFSTKMILPTENSFSLRAEWDVDPNISAVKLRWRSTPRNYTSSELSFGVTEVGNYREIPYAEVISDTGRGCEIKMAGVVNAIEVTNPGSGYTYANAVCVPDNGTSLQVNLVGDEVDSITVLASGYYDTSPEIVIAGDGASASAKVSELAVDDVTILQQGANYLSAPTVNVYGSDDLGLFLVGLTGTEVTSFVNTNNDGRIDYVRIVDGGVGYTGASVSITGGTTPAVLSATITDGSITNIEVINGGQGYSDSNTVVILPSGTGGTGAQAIANCDIFSSWVYQDANVQDGSITIPGFKYNIPYEIEILASEDENFRGLNAYTNNTSFQYYK